MTLDQLGKGMNLWRSAQNILQSGRELDSLFETVKEEIYSDPPTVNGTSLTVDWNGAPSDECAGNDWLSTIRSDHANLCISSSGRKKSPRMVASLSIHLVLVDEGDAQAAPQWTWRGNPSLLIAWHKAEETIAARWDDDGYWWNDCFDPNDEGYVNSIVPAGERLWKWYEDEMIWEDTGLFAVPIFELNNEADIQRHVVGPLKKLLDGRPEAEAFPAGDIAFRTTLAK